MVVWSTNPGSLTPTAPRWARCLDRAKLGRQPSIPGEVDIAATPGDAVIDID